MFARTKKEDRRFGGIMWKCKKCGCNRFYQTFRGIFSIEKADKNQEVIECRDNILKYSKFYCEECKKAGWLKNMAN